MSGNVSTKQLSVDVHSSVVIGNDHIEVSINPHEGAAVIAFNAFNGEKWLALRPDLREYEKYELWDTNFLLAPYSNRVRDGRFTFAEQTYQLDTTNDHAIHGDTWYRPWEIIEQTATKLVCCFDSQAHAYRNWPWHFATQVTYEVIDQTLHSTLTLCNRDVSAMPAGLGWHPYFSRHLTRPGEPVCLHFNVAGIYPDVHEERMPSGTAVSLPSHLDLVNGLLLPHDRAFDVCLTGYDGKGSIHWPESKMEIAFNCSAACTHLVMYNPVGKSFFAVEPVTNANNGLNLYAENEPTSGIVSLAAGQSLSATFDMSVNHHTKI